MSVLTLLIPAAGVAAIVLLCWLAGGTGKAVIADEEVARARLRHDEPSFVPARVLLAGDRRVALLADDSGTDIAAVMAFGDTLVCRRFARGAIRSARLHEQPDTGRSLTLLTDDPTCRRIDMLVSAPGVPEAPEHAESLAAWLAALQRLAPASAPTAAASTEKA
jgi:hypothetical protein